MVLSEHMSLFQKRVRTAEIYLSRASNDDDAGRLADGLRHCVLAIDQLIAAAKEMPEYDKNKD